MTNHWRDIKNAYVILINGSNPAEAHSVGFQWFMKAKLDPARGIGRGGGATIIHADPRFARTTAVADIHARIRVGTDVAYFGGLIRYVIEHDLIHRDYVRDYTNTSFLVGESYAFHDGLFSGYDPEKRQYDTKAWGYDVDQGEGCRVRCRSTVRRACSTCCATPIGTTIVPTWCSRTAEAPPLCAIRRCRAGCRRGSGSSGRAARGEVFGAMALTPLSPRSMNAARVRFVTLQTSSAARPS